MQAACKICIALWIFFFLESYKCQETEFIEVFAFDTRLRHFYHLNTTHVSVVVYRLYPKREEHL